MTNSFHIIQIHWNHYIISCYSLRFWQHYWLINNGEKRKWIIRPWRGNISWKSQQLSGPKWNYFVCSRHVLYLHSTLHVFISNNFKGQRIQKSSWALTGSACLYQGLKLHQWIKFFKIFCKGGKKMLWFILCLCIIWQKLLNKHLSYKMDVDNTSCLYI